MAILTFCAGMMVYYVMQRQSEDFLTRGLEHSLQVREELLVTTLHKEITKTETIATRPVLVEQMRRFNADKENAAALAILKRAAKTFLPEGFSAIAFYDRNGAEVAHAGSFSRNPELDVTLPVPTRARLLRDKTMLLHVDADMLDGGERIGHVSTEANLPSIEKLFSESTSLGKTSEVAVCAPLRQDMTCFHTALTPRVFPRIPRVQSGKPLPMSFALDGLSGVIRARDYRDHEVMAAYGPVDKLGLGMVLKVDTDELYQPIHTRLEFILLLLLALFAGGFFLLRWQVTPLVNRLARSEHEARESYENLLASDAHIRVLTEVSPVGIFRTDEQGNCIYVNERYCEITGLSLQQALGQGWVRAVHPDDSQRVLNAWKEAVDNKLPFSIECRYRQSNGEVVWILAQTTRELSESGRVRGFVGSITDFTERRRAEEALGRSEERYRSIVTVMAEGIVILQADQTIVACNPSAEHILGLNESQLVGRTLTDPRWRTIHEDGSLFQKNAHPAGITLRTGQPQVGVVMGVYREDESLVWISINTQPLIHPGGENPFTAVVSFIDITDQHRAEEALKRSEERYRNIVELAQEGIWQIDADGRTVFANHKMAQILGYTVPEMHGQSIYEFMDDEGRKITEKSLERRRRGIAERYEFRLVRKDGGEVWTLVSTNPLFDDQGLYVGALAMINDITERKRWEMALVQSEKNFHALIEDVNVGILVHFQGRHVFANTKLLNILGYTLEEFRTTTMRDIVHTDEFEKVAARYRARMEGQEVPSVYETILWTKDGASLAVELTSTRTVWEGEPAGLVLLQDVTERKQTIEQMRKLSSAVEQTADAVIITDPQGVIEYVNQAFEHTTGYRREEAMGQTPRLVKSDRQKPEFYKNLWQVILAGEVYTDVFINRRKDGSLYYEEKTITPLKDAEGRITHFVSTGKDVTERIQIQERLQYMAQHDALTDLPNRVLLFDRLKRALVRARRHQRLLGVLFIDLDRFKYINDSLGHEAGDQLLQQLSDRLRRCIRGDDTVARFGGDEFVILLEDVAREGDVHEVAQKVLEELLLPFKIGTQHLFITASIGVSLYPNDGEDSSALLKYADVAMYRAKDLGKNTYQFYSAEMSARAFERLTLESHLRHALDRGEFQLYYQPQLDTINGMLVGVEALLRWQHPKFGMVMPAEFMPMLEETGLIIPVGEWVLRTACAQLRAWHDAGWSFLRMAVNLSARQFGSNSLIASVEEALAVMGGDSAQLELEITESIFMQHAMVTTKTLSELFAMGCRLAIDDFGTGYSSLAYLKRFPINVLKIDHSFVRDIPDDKDDAEIVSTIIAMAHNLKIEVVAEGVETDAQIAFLRTCGCDFMQGYLFSRPLPAEEVVRHF